MEEIKTIGGLDALREQITAVRKECKKSPNIGKGTFLQKLLDDVPPQERECNEYNERQYSTLPDKIKITSEIGQVLQSLFLAHLQNQYAIKNKLPTTKEALSTGVETLLAVLFPNPISIGKVLYDHHSTGKKYENYSEGMNELIRAADKNMQVVLGSYQLTKTDEGDFILKRGEWFVGHYSKSNSFRGNNYKVWYTGIKDVGVDPRMVTNEQKYLFDTKNPENIRESPAVGLWEDENNQRHFYRG